MSRTAIELVSAPLDYQDEGKVEFFEGNFTEYEEYKKRTLGADALEPKRIKYKRIAK